MDEQEIKKIVRKFSDWNNPLYEAVEEDCRIFLSKNTLEHYLKIVEINAIVRSLTDSNHKADIAANMLKISSNSFRSRMNKYILELVKIPIGADYFNHSWGISIDDFLEIIERIVIEIDKDSKITNRKEVQKSKSPK